MLRAGYRVAPLVAVALTSAFAPAERASAPTADQVIAKLIASGLVTAWPECVGAGGRRVELTRIDITDAGRAALKRRA